MSDHPRHHQRTVIAAASADYARATTREPHSPTHVQTHVTTTLASLSRREIMEMFVAAQHSSDHTVIDDLTNEFISLIGLCAQASYSLGLQHGEAA